MKKIIFHYGSEEIFLQIEGQTFYGEDIILLESDDNLIKGMPWETRGYEIYPFLHIKEFNALKHGISLLVKDLIGTNDANFSLEKYHEYVNDEKHAEISSAIKNCFPANQFPIPIKKVIERVSSVLQLQTCITPPHHHELGEIFCIRIVRPSKSDNNPLHRDVWLDRLRHAVNIYAPLAGSDSRSTLGVVPGSHLWMESDIERTREGAKVNGLTYTVPAVTGSKYPLEIERPSPKSNEFMIFSPYLIHGGGINQNSNTTRVSLEMRFWRIK